MKIILIYILIGTFFSILLEIFWKYLEDEEEYSWGYKIIAIFLWPIVIILGIIKSLGNDNDDVTLSGGH